jgi:hypothetical protein
VRNNGGRAIIRLSLTFFCGGSFCLLSISSAMQQRCLDGKRSALLLRVSGFGLLIVAMLRKSLN